LNFETKIQWVGQDSHLQRMKAATLQVVAHPNRRADPESM